MGLRRKTPHTRYVHYGAPERRMPPKRHGGFGRKLALLVVLLVLGFGGFEHVQHAGHTAHRQNTIAKTAAVTVATSSSKTDKTLKPAAATQQTQAKTPPTNYCASNTLTKMVLVSISKRHLWACSGATVAYDSAVVTGMENLPADLTPTGTYQIYAKQTNLYLNGSDSTGSWHDYVYYWMPFLSNQYGVYGFHDATWRKPGDFGNISPYSSNASHGCVETPLATAKWLYNWAPIGTTVKIVT